MSRWSIDPPDDDRYDMKPPDVADEPKDGESWDDAFIRVQDGLLSGAIDPAEHAAHALIDALTDLEKEITTATTLERAHQLKALLKRAYVQVNAVDLKASAKIDALIERRR